MKFKTIKSIKYFIFIFFLAFLFLPSLTSCDSKTEKIEIKNFFLQETDEKTKTKTFVIEVKNEQHKEINLVNINDKIYNIRCNTGYTKIFVDVTEQEECSKYTLNYISYLNGEESFKCYPDILLKTLIIDENESTTPIHIKNLSFSANDKENQIYANCKAKLSLDLENSQHLMINSVVINLYNNLNDEKPIKELKISALGNINTDQTTLNCEFYIPSDSSDIIYAVVKKVYYVNENYEKKCIENLNIVKEINVATPEVQILSFEINPLIEQEVYEDINDNLFIDKNSEINLSLILKRPTNAKIAQINISGASIDINEKNVEKQLTTDKYQQEKITLKLNLNSLSEESGIKIQKLTLNSITFTNNEIQKSISPYVASDFFFVYDKIINSADDLKHITVENNEIKGNYILNNDINIDLSNSNLFFSNVSLDGIIEGNGHTLNFINSPVSITRPMFENISKNAVFQNSEILLPNMENTSSLASTNEGIIQNLSLVHETKIITSETYKEHGTLITKNLGTINDIVLKGNLDITSPIGIEDEKIALISYENEGSIYRILNNLTIRTSNFLPLDININDYIEDVTKDTLNIYVTSYINRGEIDSVILLSEEYFNDVNTLNVVNNTSYIDSFKTTKTNLKIETLTKTIQNMFAEGIIDGVNEVTQIFYPKATFIILPHTDENNLQKNVYVNEKLYTSYLNKLVEKSENQKYLFLGSIVIDEDEQGKVSTSDLGLSSSENNSDFYESLGFNNYSKNTFWQSEKTLYPLLIFEK